MVIQTTEHYKNKPDRLTKGDDIINIPNNQNKEIEDLNKVNFIEAEGGKEIVARYTKDDSHNEKAKFEELDHKDSLSSDGDRPLHTIPDGGWGWIVVFSAFLVSACVDGLAFSFGLLHEEFTSYFKTSQSKTALIGSIFTATPLLLGPIMSALVDRFGCRVTTMIAAFVSTIGFLLASISNSVEMLCLTYGLLSGLAIGVLNVTAVVSVAFWFDKTRNLALSLAACGTGFGTLLYSPLTHYLLEEYGWRGTVIILAGTLLNMCVCGAVMRNPEYLELKQKRERELSRRSSRRSSSASSISSKSDCGDSEELKSLLKSGKSPDNIFATLTTNIAEAEQLEATTQINAQRSCKRVSSASHLPTNVQQNEKIKPGQINQQRGWMRQISMDRHYFRDMTLHRNKMMHRSAMLSIPKYKLKASSLPDIYRNSEWSIASSVEMTTCDHAIELLKTMFDFRMFTEFHFMMFNLSNLILSVWFIVPYFFLNSFMNDRGTQGGETMISIIGIASTIGIVVLGWTADQPWINVIKANAIGLIICGLSVATYPFCVTNYGAISVVSAIFGMSFASFYAYGAAILMELMPMEIFTVAYGLTLFVQGIGHLAGPPIGGVLFDITGCWDLTFYVGGIWIVISGICMGGIAYTKDVRVCGRAPLLMEADDAEKSKAIDA